MDAIQKALDALETAQNRIEWFMQENPDAISAADYNMLVEIDETLSALRGMKAVDVGELKAEVDKGCPHGFYLTKCEVLDYLTANGYVIMKAGV